MHTLLRDAPRRLSRTQVARGAIGPLAAALLCSTAITQAAGQTAPAVTADATTSDPAASEAEIVVTGSLGALPLKNVGSVFGFDKTLAETPRSASSISAQQIERFGVTNIYDLVTQTPGTFTNSFFGTGGALDIRGTPGEVYFRGMRRLDNPGNYPTPIAAAERIDIVRGPASPIMGPSKTGGYMNFVPKSARGPGGSIISRPQGFVSYTNSSWSGNDIKANVVGPAKLGQQEFGFSLYGEVEHSGSYYRFMHQDQAIVQGSVDADIAPGLRLEAGGMYQDFDGQQNGGWNRLTQDLVDHGTYITGTAKPLDTNGDGQISRGEADAANGGKGLSVFGTFGCAAGTATPGVFASGFTDACLRASYPDLALQNTGTTKLSRKDVLTGKQDQLRNKQTTGYIDLTYDGGNAFTLKNQAFFDRTDNLNENSYGFAQLIKSYVFEDKIIATKSVTTSAGKFTLQASPSIRYTNFKQGDDFRVEEFHRVDLTQSYTAASDRLLATECDCNYSDYVTGHYTDYGAAVLADVDLAFGLDAIVGARYDHVTATSRADAARYDPVDLPAVLAAKGHDGGWSWNASLSYKAPFGLIPYGTISQQTTIVVGQGAEIQPTAIAGISSGAGFLAKSKLYEGGLKGEFLNKRLYAAVSFYKQKRTDFSVQSAVTNQSVETKGLEAEMRWAVDRHLLVTAAYTRTKVYNLTFQRDGTAFSFFGIEDLVNVTNPALQLGGQLEGLVPINSKSDSRRAGIPTNLYSATATYAFDNGIAINADVSHVDAVFSGQSQVVKLPAYWLANVGLSYTTGPWLFRLVGKNVNDARYFRANFTELFGSSIVLPERPRNYQATIQYKF